MLETRNPALGRTSEPGLNQKTQSHLTSRLAETKRLLVSAYCLGALTFHESEGIAARLRRRFPEWVRA